MKMSKTLLNPLTDMGGDQTHGDDASPNDVEIKEGQTLKEFVKEETGYGKDDKEDNEENGDAQKLGKTEEEKEEIEEGVEQGLGVEKQGDKKTEEDGKKKDAEGEKTEDVVEKVEEKPEEKPEGKDPVPYERFEEVNTKYRTLETQLNEVKPLAEHQSRIIEYCDTHGITDEQFRQALEVQALLNNNPEEALKRLLPIVEAVQGFTGDRLPVDLQSKVDKGILELTDAREIASLRAKSQFGTSKYDQYQKKQEEQRFQQVQRSMNNAMTSWVKTKSASNVDFIPKKSETDVDGVYEFTVDRYIKLTAERNAKGQFVNPCVTPDQVIQLLERAYNEVTKAFKPAIKTKTKPTLSSSMGGKSGGATPRPEDAKSLKEVVMSAAAGKY